MAPHFPYPPHGGALIRTWELIKFLGSRHRLTFVAITAKVPSALEQEEVAAFCESVQVYPTSQEVCPGLPEAVAPWSGPELARALQPLAEIDFDFVILEFIYLAHWASLFRCRVILCEHNIESELFRQFSLMAGGGLRWRAAALQLRAYEEKAWPNFWLRCLVSPVDRDKLESRCPEGRTMVLPNGADTQVPMLNLLPDTGRILFAGLLNYRPNQEAVAWLLQEIMPLVWEESPHTELVIAGAHPGPEMAPGDHRVRLVSNPPDMAAVAAGCSLLAVPLRRGSGTRIKILQAFAWGLPVVATTLAREGLEGDDGVHLWVRDQPQDFARALLDATAGWHRLRQNARALCEQSYDWQLIWQQLENELKRGGRSSHDEIDCPKSG